MGSTRKQLESQCKEAESERDQLQEEIKALEKEIGQAKRSGQGDISRRQAEEDTRRRLTSQLAQVSSESERNRDKLKGEIERLEQVVHIDPYDDYEGGEDLQVPAPHDEERRQPNGFAMSGPAVSQRGERLLEARHGAIDDHAVDIPPAPEPPDALQVEADSGVGWRELHAREEKKLLDYKAELRRAQAEMNDLKAAHTGELEAAAAARRELSERQQATEQVNEAKMAELRETELHVESRQRSQDALEKEAKELQRQLSQAMYDVGKKDREQQLKEGELCEVRQSIRSIQDDMDEVNKQLQAQCGRVQRVESSLRLSRGLGSKVDSMRQMLAESHAALNQLCALVEHERVQRGQCAQGLQHQQKRTELLLQLLSHFKSRTQDLAPHVLLSQATDLIQAQMAASSPHRDLLEEPIVAGLPVESGGPYEPSGAPLPSKEVAR